MLKHRTIIFVTAGLACGVAIGLVIGMVTGFLGKARSTIECTDAAIEYMQAVSRAIERGHCDAVKAQIDHLMHDGEVRSEYRSTVFAESMRKATADLATLTSK